MKLNELIETKNEAPIDVTPEQLEYAEFLATVEVPQMPTTLAEGEEEFVEA